VEARLKPRGSDRLWVLLFLIPSLFGVALGGVGSSAVSILLSFTDWNNVSPPHWVGLANYIASLKDSQFLEAVSTTLRFTIVYVPLCLVTALSAALLLNRRLPGQGFFRAAFFFPSLTSAVAVALVFSWIYAKDGGLLNRALGLVGIPPITWMGSKTIFWAVTIANVWGAVGEGMIVFLAALQAVPSLYYEAARIDGAGSLRRFFKITLPLISPAIFFQIVIYTVNALQAFEYIYMLARRQQGASEMTTAVYLIYRNGFRWFNMGLASTEAVLLALVIVIFMVLYFRAEKRFVYYE